MDKSYSIDVLDIKNHSRVLFIYPHPDDETYFNSGLIQKLIKQGVETHLLCLTKGGASTLSFSLKRDEKLTKVREKEFESVMRYLELKNYKIFDLEDGKMSLEKERAYKITNEEIENIKPNFVITFEPFGVYGHPDHIFTNKMVSKLCQNKKIKLIYSTVDKNYKPSKASLKICDNYIKQKPVEPNIQLKLTFNEYIRKLKCLGLYKSQVSLRGDFFHKIRKAIKMIDEYYFVLK